MKCAECGKETENILLDEMDKLPLEFCSWECLVKYAAKKVCQLKEVFYDNRLG